MKFDLTSHDVSFKAPHDQPYDPLTAYANGRDIFNELRTWELKVVKGKITLNNEVGATYDLGEANQRIVRCSLAFLRFTQPYIVFEYEDGESRLYRYDLVNKELTFKLSLKGYKDMSLFYSRASFKDKLLLTALQLKTAVKLGDEDRYEVMVGEMDMENGTLRLDVVQSYPATHDLQIHRFGLTVTDQVKIEIVSVSES